MSDLKYSKMIGVIDQGTSSSRFVLFSAMTGEVVAKHQLEISREHPQSGWVQQSANDIYQSTLKCMNAVGKILRSMKVPVKVRHPYCPDSLEFVISPYMWTSCYRILQQLELPINEKLPLLGIAKLASLCAQPLFGLILALLTLFKNTLRKHQIRIRILSRFAP